MSVEHTLAIIKPEGMAHEKEIMKVIKKAGFVVLARRTIHLTPEQASDFYQERYGGLDFPLLVAATSSAPVAVLCLGRQHAVHKLNQLVGSCDIHTAKRETPLSLNARYGNPGCNLAAVHASKDIPAARREIRYFFPQAYVEPVSMGVEYLEREVNPLLKQGLAELAREKPAEPMLWLAGWLLKNNPNTPQTQEHLRHQHFDIS